VERNYPRPAGLARASQLHCLRTRAVLRSMTSSNGSSQIVCGTLMLYILGVAFEAVAGVVHIG
jgi:hypothetical protein